MRMRPTLHPDEGRRIAKLLDLDILDSEREESFDDITALAATICESPVAIISFVDRDRQWFKSEIGLGVSSTTLGESICAHAILQHELLDIPDTQADERTQDNPLCLGDGFRSYLGAQLRMPDGLPVGSLCVLDRVPRDFTEAQKDALRRLARQVMRLVQLRSSLAQQTLLRSEVNHRVKNSFQSVSAMLSLQGRDTQSEPVRKALGEASQRVARIAALHEELNISVDDTSVDFPRYVHRLQQLFEQSLAGQPLPPLDVEPLALNPDQANAVGSVISEFVANAYKHSFHPGDEADVRISGKHEGDHYRLVMSHGGHIAPGVLDRIAQGKGLGTRLIKATVRSLQWGMDWTFEDGQLALAITLPVPKR